MYLWLCCKGLRYRGYKYTIFVEDCDEKDVSGRLEDPRYYISSSVDGGEVHDLDLGSIYKFLPTLDLEFADDDDSGYPGERRRKRIL